MRIRSALLAGLVALGLAGTTTAAAVPAAPNPYGDYSSSYLIEVRADGGYQVTHNLTRELRLEAALDFDTVLPDYVRLPDDGTQPLPGLLRVPITDVTAELEGKPVEVTDSSIGHRIELSMPSQQLPPGDYEGVWSYTRLAASIAADDGTTLTYVQVGQNGTVTIKVPEGLIGVQCRATPDVFVDCGEPLASGWTLSGADRVAALDAKHYYAGPFTMVVKWRSADAQLAPAEISHS